MPETKHFTTKATVTPDGDGQGLLEVVFSTFDTIDSQGDVVLKSTFTEGQEVPMVWSHDWDRPIGKGTVHVTSKTAVFKGQLWLDTDDGLQAFRKIRNSGGLQEFSWGFQILEAEPGVKDGQPVRFIKDAEVFEVSPVLVGANRHTHVLSLKAAAAELVKAAEAPPEAAAVVEEQPPLPEPDPEPEDEPEETHMSLKERAEFTGEAAWLLVQGTKVEPMADDETREALQLAAKQLDYACKEVAAALKRTDPIAQVEPRNQYRRFMEFAAQHGLLAAPVKE